MGTTDSYGITETKLKRIAWLSGRDEHKQFTSLMHHFNEASLKDCFHRLDGKKAVATDGVTKENFSNTNRHVNGSIMSLVPYIVIPPCFP